MRGSINDLPVAFELQGARSQQVEWGEMNVALEHMPAGLDTAPLFKGLPNDSCQCPHWGYVLKGRMRVRYADHDEIVNAGDLYYLAPGHLPFFEEETDIIEFSPRGEYQKTIEVAERNLAAMQQEA